MVCYFCFVDFRSTLNTSHFTYFIFSFFINLPVLAAAPDNTKKPFSKLIIVLLLIPIIPSSVSYYLHNLYSLSFFSLLNLYQINFFILHVFLLLYIYYSYFYLKLLSSLQLQTSMISLSNSFPQVFNGSQDFLLFISRGPRHYLQLLIIFSINNSTHNTQVFFSCLHTLSTYSH